MTETLPYVRRAVSDTGDQTVLLITQHGLVILTPDEAGRLGRDLVEAAGPPQTDWDCGCPEPPPLPPGCDVDWVTAGSLGALLGDWPATMPIMVRIDGGETQLAHYASAIETGVVDGREQRVIVVGGRP